MTKRKETGARGGEGNRGMQAAAPARGRGAAEASGQAPGPATGQTAGEAPERGEDQAATGGRAPDAVRRRVALLDDNGRLIGDEWVDDATGRVEIGERCDLPMDGTYKWTGACFLPLGAGYKKPPRPPVDFLYVIRRLIDAAPDVLPKEVRDWAAWYDRHQSAQAEERLVLHRKLGR